MADKKLMEKQELLMQMALLEYEREGDYRFFREERNKLSRNNLDTLIDMELKRGSWSSANNLFDNNMQNDIFIKKIDSVILGIRHLIEKKESDRDLEYIVKRLDVDSKKVILRELIALKTKLYLELVIEHLSIKCMKLDFTLEEKKSILDIFKDEFGIETLYKLQHPDLKERIRKFLVKYCKDKYLGYGGHEILAKIVKTWKKTQRKEICLLILEHYRSYSYYAFDDIVSKFNVSFTAKEIDALYKKHKEIGIIGLGASTTVADKAVHSLISKSLYHGDWLKNEVLCPEVLARISDRFMISILDIYLPSHIKELEDLTERLSKTFITEYMYDWYKSERLYSNALSYAIKLKNKENINYCLENIFIQITEHQYYKSFTDALFEKISNIVEYIFSTTLENGLSLFIKNHKTEYLLKMLDVFDKDEYCDKAILSYIKKDEWYSDDSALLKDRKISDTTISALKEYLVSKGKHENLIECKIQLSNPEDYENILKNILAKDKIWSNDETRLKEFFKILHRHPTENEIIEIIAKSRDYKYWIKMNPTEKAIKGLIKSNKLSILKKFEILKLSPIESLFDIFLEKFLLYISKMGKEYTRFEDNKELSIKVLKLCKPKDDIIKQTIIDKFIELGEREKALEIMTV